MRYRVLWIEDRANDTWHDLLGPVYNAMKYDITIAFNATEALELLLSSEYDVVIADIRIPPGGDRRWVKMFDDSGRDKKRAKLGLHLLLAILGPKKNVTVPEWIVPDRFGILSVESRENIGRDVDSMKIVVYRERNAYITRYVLLELIRQVLSRKDGGSKTGDPEYASRS